MAKREDRSDSKLLGAGEDKPKPYNAPMMTPGRSLEIERATKAHVEAHRSDPFAGRRISMYMRRGLALPPEVLADATKGKTAAATNEQ